MNLSAVTTSQHIANVEVTRYTDETKRKYELTLTLDDYRAPVPYIIVFGMNRAEDAHKSLAKIDVFADEQWPQILHVEIRFDETDVGDSMFLGLYYNNQFY